jgi:WS/DGAT/MGAT family acyltransferase
MEQLPGSDAIFLAMETENSPGHVGGLTVLDASQAPDFGFEKLARVVDERIRLEPRFTRRLRELPLGLDRPYLVDYPEFDVREHLHRIAVPAPGGMRELAELAGYLFARPLRRDRPLWEMWLIEGVENGRFAMLMKSHHCLMDGMAGSGIGELLCDLEPEPKDGPLLAPRDDVAPAEEPSALSMAVRATRHLAGSPLRTLRLGARLLRQGAAMAFSTLRDESAPPLPTAVPELPWNRNPGPRRAFACASVPLAAVKELKKHFDVTVNDVVLALTASALRGSLLEQGALPDRPLVATIAVSTRAEGAPAVGNAVTSASVGLATDLGDPRERLLRIHRNARTAKELAQRYDGDLLAGLGDALPPGLVQLFVRAYAPGGPAPLLPGNVVVSNVRGTPIPLYTAGARIECMYPLSLLAPGQGLNVTVVSYMGRVDFGFTADPDLVPDVWQLASGIPTALEELEQVRFAPQEAA